MNLTEEQVKARKWANLVFYSNRLIELIEVVDKLKSSAPYPEYETPSSKEDKTKLLKYLQWSINTLTSSIAKLTRKE